MTDASLTNEDYGYDATGNRTTGGTTTGADNRVTEDDNYTYTYDDEGNLLTRTAKDGSGSQTFTWDYRNRLTQAVTRDGDGNVTLTATYEYDAFDRRIRRTVTGSTTLDEQYLYDGTSDADVVLVADGEGNVTLRQLNGPGSNQVLAEDRISGSTTTTRWALADHEGTVRDVIDNSGTVADHIIYGSYGNILSQTNPAEQMRATYTGAPTDAETSFVYLHHRYLDPTTGRWMSQDPLSFGAGDVNLYRYVANSPLSSTDSSGYCPQLTEEERKELELQRAILILDITGGKCNADNIRAYYETLILLGTPPDQAMQIISPFVDQATQQANDDLEKARWEGGMLTPGERLQGSLSFLAKASRSSPIRSPSALPTRLGRPIQASTAAAFSMRPGLEAGLRVMLASCS